MKRALAAVAASVAIVGAGIFTASDTRPGPIPTCNGEQATRVMVAELTQLNKGVVADTPDGRIGPFPTVAEARAAAIEPYADWTAAGVKVIAAMDAAFAGTVGHDVMVSLVSTKAGGFVGDPFPKSATNQPPVAGDFLCSFLLHSQDIYYLGGFSDVVIDEGGADGYWMGGCALEGEGSPGDRGCDVLFDNGNSDSVGGIFGDNRDDTFGFTVPKGRIQRLNGGIGWNHFYVGRGAGKVIVSGGGCEVNIDGQTVSCVGHVPNGGDHIHPCKGDQDQVFLPGGDQFTRDGITSTGIEYVGPEIAGPNLPPADIANPCAYEFKTA